MRMVGLASGEGVRHTRESFSEERIKKSIDHPLLLHGLLPKEREKKMSRKLPKKSV